MSTVSRLWIERSERGAQRRVCKRPDAARGSGLHSLPADCGAFQSSRAEAATIHPDEKHHGSWRAVAGSSVTASAMVEAAKSGLEYRPSGDGEVLVARPKGTPTDRRRDPCGDRTPSAQDELSALLNRGARATAVRNRRGSRDRARPTAVSRNTAYRSGAEHALDGAGRLLSGKWC